MKRRRTERTTCQNCYGGGRLTVARASMLNSQSEIAGVVESCKPCEGRGYIEFVVEADVPESPAPA